MSHLFESGMFVKEPAWHRLGKVLDAPPTVMEAIIEAGLDWEVTKEPLFLKEPEISNNLQALGDSSNPYSNRRTDRHALVRSTDRSILGYAGNNYRPLQNIEAFKFFDPFLDNKVATLETAGSLRKGKNVWVLAKLNGLEGDVVANDPITTYLLLSNTHTGRGAIKVIFTPTRVVCWNTLSFAEEVGEARKSPMVKIYHSQNIAKSLEMVQKAVKFAPMTFSSSLEQYRAMARREISVTGLKKYVRRVLEVSDEDTNMPREWEGIEAAFEAGPGADIRGVGGTVWNAYNSITHYCDHQRGRTDATRLFGTWFGSAVPGIRRRAHNEAMALVKNS